VIAAPIAVRCPWCLARPGEPCLTNAGAPKKRTHGVRLIFANHGEAATAVITRILRDQEARIAADAEQHSKERE
jgi:hypothetical protein